VRSKILIADDEPVTRAAVKKVVTRRGWEVVVCDNGHDAAAQFDLENPPDVAVLDWMMPGLDGSELCMRLRKKKVRAYLIMLTGRTRPEDLVQALAAGADDYVRKPFDWSELIARIKVGVRVSLLQRQLDEKVLQLQASLANAKQLGGLLPICSYCKRIRDDRDYWNGLEHYISSHSDAKFTHGVCPSCMRDALSEVEAAGKPRAAS
jgi:sigma-B regulation protein RsbU (phosphoserine phosphatase)